MVTYSDNTGITLIGTGEQSGTWGDTTNVNLQIIDRLTNGVGTITVSSSNAKTITTTNGALSDGQYAVLVFENDAVPPTGAVSVTISPNDQDKVFIIKNNSTQSLVFSQGSGDNTSVAANKSAIIYCDGGGASAAITNVTSTFEFQPLNENLTEIAALSTSVGYAIVGNGAAYVGTNTSTDAMLMPSGTTAERPAPANGMLRYNTDESAFEGYANNVWGAIGGGGTQGGGAIVVNQQTADENYTFPSGTNGFSVGPITIANGATVTISNGQRWVVI
tara:strand:+ start:2423 stop:3250 length:828 start_codon:yes stop_codon:yes gene_type:complete